MSEGGLHDHIDTARHRVPRRFGRLTVQVFVRAAFGLQALDVALLMREPTRDPQLARRIEARRLRELSRPERTIEDRRVRAPEVVRQRGRRQGAARLQARARIARL